MIIEDDDYLEKLRRQLADEEAKRETEKSRLQQEVELKEEQVKLQKQALEAARDAFRIKKEKDDAEENERLR